MVRCGICGSEVDDRTTVCPDGHTVGDGPGGVVGPAEPSGNGGEAKPIHPSPGQAIRLVTLERTSADSLLRETLGVLAEEFGTGPYDDLAAAVAAPVEPVAPASAIAAEGSTEPTEFTEPAEPTEPTEFTEPGSAEAGSHGMGSSIAADMRDVLDPPAGDVEPSEDHMLVPPEIDRSSGDGPAAVGPGVVAPGGERGALLGGDLIGKPAAATHGSRRRLVVVPVILAVLAGAGAFVMLGSGNADAATYRRLFTPEETHRYAFEMTMDGAVEAGPVREPMAMRMGMTVTERTLAVDQDGTATIRQSIGSMELSVNGERVVVPGLGDVAVTVRMAPDGRVLSVEGFDGLGLGGSMPAADLLGPNSFTPLLPSQAVAPGDEWTVTEEMPTPFGSSMTMTARNRLVQRGIEGGVETALIRSELEIPMDLRIGAEELLAAAGQAGVGAADLPADAAFVYGGGMKMELLQTVAVTSGRPLTISGSGSADITMKITGVPGAPEMRMRFSISATVAELRGAKDARSASAADPLSSA